MMRPFVAQLEVLKRAAVFVTHGGLNSVHEGLVYGAPMVVIPQQSEQGIVADRVQATGSGVLLSKKSVSAVTLRAEVEQILANRDAYQKWGAA